MNKMFRAIGSAVFAMAFAAVSPGFAHDHATGIVKERMDAMESMAKHMKAVSERIKNKRDLAAIKMDAEAIAALAPHITHQFPPGSTQHPTQAKASIWQNWADFESKARVLEIESGKLAKMSSEDFGAFSTQMRAVSQACGSCHEQYRAKK